MSQAHHNVTSTFAKERGPQQYTEDIVRIWNEFADWDGRRRTEGGWPERQLAAHGVKSVLDASAGTGFHAVQLAKADLEVFAIDGSQAMVDAARLACAEHGVEVAVERVNWFDIPHKVTRRFDAVVLLGNSLAHADSHEERVTVLQNLRRVLHPGGVLLVDARAYDSMLDRGRPLSGEKVFTGRVGGQAVALDETQAVFEYRASAGQVGTLAVTPIRRTTLVAELREAGFEGIRTFGDFEEDYDPDDVDFISVVATVGDADDPVARPTKPAPPAPFRPAGVVVDVDGPLRNGGQAIQGAAEVLDQLRADGHPLVALSNTTGKSSSALAQDLRGIGILLDEGEVITASSMTAHYLKQHHPGARVFWLGEGFPFDEGDDLAFVLDDEEADVVLIGGNGPRVTFDRVNVALAHLRRGAVLVAMHRNEIWCASTGSVVLDIGFVVTGLEQASGIKATVIGKPSPAAFDCALDALGVPAAGAIMVGDDVRNDVLAAQALGLRGVLVLTGKTAAADVAAAAAPQAIDHVIGSIADLPQLLSSLSVPNAL